MGDLSNQPPDNSRLWYRLIVDGPDLADGAQLRSFLEKTLAKYAPSAMIRVSHLECVPFVPDELQEYDQLSPILTSDRLFQLFDGITQVVWGRIFVFASLQDVKMLGDKPSLLQTIAQSRFTVCVADNSSYFIFTRLLPLVHEILAENQRVEVVKSDLISILGRRGDF